MIYIDSDDVLFDFQGVVKALTGEPYQGGLSWKILEQRDRLFWNLPVLEGAKEGVLQLCNTFGKNNVQVLTALPKITKKLVTAQVDKGQAVHEFIADIQVNCVQHWSHKEYFCRSKYDILIDDSSRNCSAWESAGGIAILHTDWYSTLQQVKLKIKGVTND